MANIEKLVGSESPLEIGLKINEIIENSGSGMPIGTIYPLACTKDYVPEGSLPCDGTEYTKAQFTDLWDNYIVTALLNTCTYDEYATDLATYGECGKFAVDTTNNKFKVPTIKDGAVIQQALSNSELGKAYNAGLPNLYGQFGTGQNEYFDGVLFTQSDNIKDDTAEGGSSDTSAIFDASKYNPIYGNSDTVQMNAVALRHFVVVANGSINQSQMDWSQWASNLQSKMNADHSNDPYPYIKEMYQNGTSWYVLYSNGWCRQGGYYAGTGSATSIKNTMTLLKPYANTTYTVVATGQDAGDYIGIPERTTNTFTYQVFDRGSNTVCHEIFYWVAEGSTV